MRSDFSLNSSFKYQVLLLILIERPDAFRFFFKQDALRFFFKLLSATVSSEVVAGTAYCC